MKVGKYEFNSEEQALKKIKNLGIYIDVDGNEAPSHRHTIIILGQTVLQEAKYSVEKIKLTKEEKESIERVHFNTEYKEIYTMTENPILGVYRVDVLWQGIDENPYGWKSYEIDLDDEGTHSFGISYLENKI